MIRVVVAGCRDYCNYDEARKYINECISAIEEKSEIVIVSGGAKGADMLGERYALENGLMLERYSADWKTYGRKAGPLRNKQMAEICDMVICFWDGNSKGTRSMIELAKKKNKKVFVKYFE